MLNKVMLIGRLTRDVELKTIPSGKAVANASLATNKKFKNQSGEKVEEVEFHNLVIWQGAENFAKYLEKGSKVYVEGELKTRNWEKDGVKRYATEVVVNNFTFLDEKKATNNVDKAVESADNIQIKDLPF